MQYHFLKIVIQTIVVLWVHHPFLVFAQSNSQKIQHNFEKLTKAQDMTSLEKLLSQHEVLLAKLDSLSFWQELNKMQQLVNTEKDHQRYLAISQTRALLLTRRRKINLSTRAITILDKLVNEAHEWSLYLWEGKLCSRIGDIYQRNNLYPEAYAYYIKAERILKKHKHRDEWVDVLYKIALNLYSDKGFKESVQYFRQVIAQATPKTKPRHIISSWNSIGLLKRKMGDLDSAQYYLNQTLEQAKVRKDTAWIGIANGNMGTLYALKKNYPEAKKRYLKDIAISHRYAQWGSEANALASLADIYLEQNDLKKAKQYFDSSLYICDQYPSLPNSRVRTYKGLATLYASIQQFETAHQYLLLYTRLNDSIQGKTHENQLKKMKLVQQFREEERQKKRRNENQLQALKAFQSKAFQVLLFSLLMVALVILILLYRNLETKKKANQQLAFKQQEILQQNQRLQQQQEEILSQNETIEQKSHLLTTQYEEILHHKTLLEAQNQHLEQAYQNVRLLTNIGQHITSSLDLNEILQAIYTHVNHLMDASNFEIGLYESQSKQITFELTMINGQPQAAYTQPMHDKNQLAVWCIEHGQPIMMGDFVQEYHRYLGDAIPPSEVLTKYQPALTPKSIIYIPLIIQQEIKGVLLVLSNQKNAYTHQHFDLLKSLSVYVAIAIENAQGYKELAAQKDSIAKQNNLISLLLNENQHRIGNDFVAVYAKIAAIANPNTTNIPHLIDSAKARINEAMELQNLLRYHFHGSNQTLKQSEILDKLQVIVYTLYRIHLQENDTHTIQIQSEVKSLDKNRFVLIGFCVFELVKNICKHAFKPTFRTYAL